MKKYFWLLILLPALSWADSYVVSIEGMHCESCAKNITKNLVKDFEKEKIKDVKVDFAAKKATFEAEKIDQEKIKKSIEALGFTVKSVEIKSSPSS